MILLFYVEIVVKKTFFISFFLEALIAILFLKSIFPRPLIVSQIQFHVQQ